MIKKSIVFALVLATTPALAQSSQDDCDVGARMRQAATEAADRERQMLEQIAQRQKQLTMQASSCIDKYMGMNLSSMLGFTSLDFGGLVQGMISGAANAACRVIDNKVNEVTQPFNQSMVLPGGVGRVDTRLFGTTGNVSVSAGVPGVVPQVPIAGASTSGSAGQNQTGLIDRAAGALSNLFK
ncbi:MAG: hypothetical protein L6Q52_00900 [Rhodocyclaceae bacterium]|nr:hypothetical protein [Rhodocyclaceae bacterium]